MKHVIASFTIGVCLLALPAGAAFADNLHNGTTNTTGVSTTGQTGTQPLTGRNSTKPAIASCGGGAGTIGGGAKTNGGVGSPFGLQAGIKVYAGAGAGNSGSNPNSSANSQYDNACAQAQLH